jgi:hypothetical protein
MTRAADLLLVALYAGAVALAAWCSAPPGPPLCGTPRVLVVGGERADVTFRGGGAASVAGVPARYRRLGPWVLLDVPPGTPVRAGWVCCAVPARPE